MRAVADLPSPPTLLLLAALAASALGGCREPDPRGPGTRRMAERLAALAAATDTASPYANALRVRALREARPGPGDPGRVRHAARLGQELLRAGRLEEAIATLRTLQEELQGRAGARAELAATVAELLATSYLYLALRENCVEPANADACLVPTPPAGVHAERRAARAAAAVEAAALGRRPGEAGARWLLNVAWMLLGDHPDSVPDGWAIPPAAFEPEADIGRFHDVAPAVGVDVLGHAGGSIAEDFDGDGLLDLFVSSWRLDEPVRYLRNEGDGTFADRSREAGLAGITGGLNLVQADYDGDGRTDVLVLRGGWLEDGQPNSLLRNRGDGTFEDVTEAAGLLEPALPTQTAAWADYDGDGLLDLFVGNEARGDAGIVSQLFRNRGDGTFEDVAREAGAAVGGVVKGVVWGDYDDDGRPDLYLSRHGQPNVLLRNEGPADGGSWRFRDVTAAAGVAGPRHSFPTWFWDYDGDGRLDLFASGFDSRFGDLTAELLGLPHGAELPRLYRNRGDGTFADATAAAGLDRIVFAMGANFGDLDNDGWPDLYAGTGDMDVRALLPNRAFRNAGGGRFLEVTASGGFGHLLKGHGVSFADLDNDGDQDVHITVGGALEGDVGRNALFLNPGHGARWITLRLEGVRSNRSAIGARVRVAVETPAGPREIHRLVSSGGSFGANPLRLEIGLGDALSVREVAVTWPATGETDVHRGLVLDAFYRIREGEAARRRHPPAVRFPLPRP